MSLNFIKIYVILKLFADFFNKEIVALKVASFKDNF